MSAMREDWQVLLSLFPAGWAELGRSTGAVTRLRGFDSLNDLFRTLLLHVGCGWSLRETAVQAKLAGIADVSDVTLLNRLRQSEEWLRQLCQQLWKENGVSLEPALKGQPVRLVDATVVKEPGKTGGQWRIHYSIRLPSLECDHFDLTPVKGKNTGERLGRFGLQAGELVLADAGYSNPPGVAAVVGHGADVCVRLNRQSLPLWDEKGRPFVSGGGGRGHFGGPVGATPLIAGGGEWRNGCRPEPSQQAEVFVMSFLRHGQIYQSDVA